MVLSVKIKIKEVRSKILFPLETSGGISFSLEGFEKSRFTIQNFMRGDLHSTGGIQISFQGVYNSTALKGFRYSPRVFHWNYKPSG